MLVQKTSRRTSPLFHESKAKADTIRTKKKKEFSFLKVLGRIMKKNKSDSLGKLVFEFQVVPIKHGLGVVKVRILLFLTRSRGYPSSTRSRMRFTRS